jgi:hypothetical protein
MGILKRAFWISPATHSDFRSGRQPIEAPPGIFQSSVLIFESKVLPSGLPVCTILKKCIRSGVCRADPSGSGGAWG